MATTPHRYTVESVSQIVEPQPDNRLAPITVITYRLANGTVGTVRLMGHNIDPATAKTALDADAARLNAIRNLG